MDKDELKLLQAIFDNAVDGIITINTRGLIENINPAAANLFGYSAEEVKGRNVKMLMPEPYHGEHDNYIHNYNRTGVKKIIGIGREVKGQRKDKTIFPFFLSISEVQLDDGIVYTGVIHDISALKQKEKELEASRNQLKAIFETAVDGIIIINRRGIIQMVNKAVSNLFGFREEEMLKQNIKMLMPEPYHGEHDGYLDTYQKSRKKTIIGSGREVKGQKKNGEKFPLHLSVSEVKLENEEVLYTGIIHDLTSQKQREGEIKKLNENLEQLIEERTEELSMTVNELLSVNKRLEGEVNRREVVEKALKKSESEIKEALAKERELNELKSRFVSMASHEFRTPLSTILSSAALISRYTKEEQQEKRDKHIERIKSSVSNLSGILNDFLSLSKLEEGKVILKPESFEWNAYVKDVVEEMQGLLKEGQEIIIKFNRNEIEVCLDKQIIKNILFNLLSNAIKYSKENQSTFIETTLEGKELKIKVKDQGIGIPEQDQVHLFSRFFRADNVENIKGTGLGLNIVKNYIDLLKGGIYFESEEGKGTTFFLEIPVE